jgi:glycosyltransferase involved in cell wall biosynthesis
MPGALITVIVLTRDEERNLPFLLASLEGLPCRVQVVDSGSVDRTLEIARAHGGEIATRAWTTYADQINWALENLPIDTPWTMRMDADERLTPALAAELLRKLPELPDDVTGLLIKRQVWFWGRWIRHGGYYPTWLLRVWRTGRARCEARAMDEHMVVDGGNVVRLEHDIIDENHKGLTFWTDKHNRYADREVKDILSARRASGKDLADQAAKRRWYKENLYLRAPLFFRAFAYWFMRYVILLGFLDGRPGLVFHFLQGFWYRFLVDAKLWEARRSQREFAATAPVPTSGRPSDA